MTSSGFPFNSRIRGRPWAARASLALALLALLSTNLATARAPRDFDRSRWRPTALFAQAGAVDEHTDGYAVGATWNWRWNRQYRLGLLTGYTEVTVGRWNTDNPIPHGPSWFTQVGVTPVLRLYPEFAGSSGHRWFTELGVGANYITPLYHTESKTFSTEFNFGDHIAFGRVMGLHRQATVALRLQHFSNGGIDAPNPGENFAQLRYAYAY
jgi:hypothetical protein